MEKILNTADYIFIRNDKGYDKVWLSDIRYILGDAEYLSIHVCGHEKPLSTKSSFASMKRLLTDSFVQIHRSHIINMGHLSRVVRGGVVMDDGVMLRVSDSGRQQFYEHVHSLTVGKFAENIGE